MIRFFQRYKKKKTLFRNLVKNHIVIQKPLAVLSFSFYTNKINKTENTKEKNKIYFIDKIYHRIVIITVLKPYFSTCFKQKKNCL